MIDNFINDIFDNVYEHTSKPFREVFRLHLTEFGFEIEPTMPIKIGQSKYEAFNLMVNPEIQIKDCSLISLIDKYLVGRVHTHSKVFEITDYSETY
jgi:hypothetical protein